MAAALKMLIMAIETRTSISVKPDVRLAHRFCRFFRMIGYIVSWLPPFIGKRVYFNRAVPPMGCIPLDLNLDLPHMVPKGCSRSRDRRGAVVNTAGAGIAFFDRYCSPLHCLRSAKAMVFSSSIFWWASMVAWLVRLPTVVLRTVSICIRATASMPMAKMLMPIRTSIRVNPPCADRRVWNPFHTRSLYPISSKLIDAPSEHARKN